MRSNHSLPPQAVKRLANVERRSKVECVAIYAYSQAGKRPPPVDVLDVLRLGTSYTVTKQNQCRSPLPPVSLTVLVYSTLVISNYPV
jgi:hypothetical protein